MAYRYLVLYCNNLLIPKKNWSNRALDVKIVKNLEYKLQKAELDFFRAGHIRITNIPIPIGPKMGQSRQKRNFWQH